MIALLRVDDRLVHGQVTVGWVPHLRATLLVVANDRIAADPLLAGILRSGAGTARVEVLTVAEAARDGASGAWGGETVLVLVESLQDARRLVEAGFPVARLNLGGLRHDEGNVCLCEGVTLDRDDCAILRDLTRRGIAIEVRLMPRDRCGALPEEIGGPAA